MSKVNWLDKPIKGVLLDISGVLRDGDIAIPGSIEAFTRLSNSGIPFRLVTNESQVTREGSQNKLTKLGYPGVTAENISAPAPILAEILKKENLKPHFLIHPGLTKEFEGLDTSQPNCVVLGDAAEHFTYDSMNSAFRTILAIKARGEKPRIFTLGKGRYYKENDELCLDVGAFAAGLEYATDIESELVGKPSAAFFHGALSSINVQPSDAVMIGDDIMGDVQGAKDAGLRGVLVRTGKFRPADENHPVVKPDGIVNNLAEAIELILGQQR